MTVSTIRVGADVRAFMARLGHDFARPDLLVRALTHGSIASTTRPDNQRLDFLGDRVLGLVMAEALFDAEGKETDFLQRILQFLRMFHNEALATAAFADRLRHRGPPQPPAP